jgi:hypothetical protein
VLRCDRGDEHAALAWQGSPPGGHHREGVVQFAALEHSSSAIEIVMRDIGGMPERVFRWDVGRASDP